MFRLPGKAVLIPAAILICMSCSFADLRPIGLSTVPDAPWALLPGEDSTVSLLFDTEMEKLSVERAVQILSPNGAVEGRLSWEGRSMHFVSDAPWRPGIRYGLRLSGTVTALDGRQADLSKDIPFYAVSRSALPYVESFFPPDGGSVGISGFPGGSGSVFLELRFSHSMDRRSAEDALKFDVPGEKIIEWQDDGRTMLVSSASPLNPWITYRWSISERALSSDGAPLAKEFLGRFVTDLDREFISVVRVLPLIPPETFEEICSSGNGLWGAWLPAALSLEPGPGAGQGIGVEFSKAVDEESLLRAFNFVPSLQGRVEILSPVSAVFIPAKDMEPETVYQMRISGVLKDRDGLKMGDDYTVTFKSDIPYLRITSVSFVQEDEDPFPESGSLVPVKVIAGGIARCIINFSHSFEESVREESAFRISLHPFFPATLPPLSLRWARWISPDRLLLEWEGPEGGKDGEAHYYNLLVPAGLHNGKGSYLKEDFVLYLEAEHE